MNKEKRTIGQEFLDRLDKILDMCLTSNKKLDSLYHQHLELYDMLKGFYKFNLRSQIPYMTPKQLVSLKNRGWTVEELSYISGYSLEDVNKKIAGYKNV